MKKLNKKAAYLVLTLISFGLVASMIFFYYIAIDDVIKQRSVTFIGEKELQLAKAQFVSQKHLSIVDQGARLAAYKTIFELGFEGGHAQDTECGEYQNTKLWNTADKKCYPSKAQIEQDFADMFKFNFVPYRQLLSSFNLSQSYDYFYENGEIIGVADRNFVYNNNIPGLVFSSNPSFRENIYFDIDVFVYLQEFVESLSECNKLKIQPLEKCITVRQDQAQIKHSELNITVNDCKTKEVTLPNDFETERKIVFCANVLNKQYPFSADKESGLKTPEIHFAVTIP